MRRLIIFILVIGLARSAMAQDGGFSGFKKSDGPAPVPTQVPDAMKDVGIDEKPDAQLPMDTRFTDEMGRSVTLRDCIANGKPAILQLGYFGCPMLCDLVSQGMLDSMRTLDLQMAKDFNVINISFDPRETKNDAYLKKKGFAQRYGRPGPAEGWHFLVGEKDAVKAVADAVGFKYKWVEESQQFSHAAAIIVLTPDGRVSRYLYGVKFPEQTLRLSLVEASQGKIGSTTDQVLLLCFHYSPTEGRYTLAAMGLMRIGGVLTMLVLGTVLVRLFVKERRAARAEDQTT
jgi:protein SCO1/2